MNKPVQGEERAAALMALSDDQRKRLMAFARIRSAGTDFEDDDLFNEAVLRWMKSAVPMVGQDETCRFLVGAINGILSNHRRHERVVEKYDGRRVVAVNEDDGDPAENVADPMAATDGMTFIQQVYDLCDDDEIRELVMAQADNAKPDDIKREFGWDDTRYDTVLKRKRRMAIRLMREGKLR